MKDFKPIANINSYLSLYLGTDGVVAKPAPPIFIRTVSTLERRTRNRTAEAEDPAYTLPPVNYQYELAFSLFNKCGRKYLIDRNSYS